MEVLIYYAPMAPSPSWPNWARREKHCPQGCQGPPLFPEGCSRSFPIPSASEIFPPSSSTYSFCPRFALLSLSLILCSATSDLKSLSRIIHFPSSTPTLSRFPRKLWRKHVLFLCCSVLGKPLSVEKEIKKRERKKEKMLKITIHHSYEPTLSVIFFRRKENLSNLSCP